MRSGGYSNGTMAAVCCRLQSFNDPILLLRRFRRPTDSAQTQQLLLERTHTMFDLTCSYLDDDDIDHEAEKQWIFKTLHRLEKEEEIKSLLNDFSKFSFTLKFLIFLHVSCSFLFY